MSTRAVVMGLAMVLGAACGGAKQGPGATAAVKTCFVTAGAIRCVDGLQEDRARSEYPSVCVDEDSDRDGTPDFLDDGSVRAGVPAGDDRGADDVGDDHDGAGESHRGLDDSIRCRVCDRGPGQSGEYLLVTSASGAELKRGTVVSVDGGVVTVAAAGGTLDVVTDYTTGIPDGMPSPGAEIRAVGTLDPSSASTLVASRVEILCPGPTAVADGSVPGNATPVAESHRRQGGPDDAAGNVGADDHGTDPATAVDDKGTDPAAQPADDKGTDPVAQPADDKGTDPAAQPADDKGTDPVAQPADDKGTDPAAQPADDKGTDPVAQPADDKGGKHGGRDG